MEECDFYLLPRMDRLQLWLIVLWGIFELAAVRDMGRLYLQWVELCKMLGRGGLYMLVRRLAQGECLDLRMRRALHCCLLLMLPI